MLCLNNPSATQRNRKQYILLSNTSSPLTANVFLKQGNSLLFHYSKTKVEISILMEKKHKNRLFFLSQDSTRLLRERLYAELLAFPL